MFDKPTLCEGARLDKEQARPYNKSGTKKGVEQAANKGAYMPGDKPENA